MSMIIKQFLVRAKNKESKIGIGLADTKFHNDKILYAIIKFLHVNKSKVFLFGNKESTDMIRNNSSYDKYEESIKLVETPNPTETIFQYLQDYKINAIVRGSLNSTDFLTKVSEIFKISIINRLALLETSGGYQFFLGGVGIDECNNLENKKDFLNKAFDELEALDMKPKVSILSGGRRSDLGRDPRVDETIKEADELITHFKNFNPELDISHDEILIEDAIEKKANLIIAPDGISGNLIYRTLTHLGNGKAYGAIYMGLRRVLIDTSRVGKLSEIYGGLVLALALSS
jgi:putative methanogen marker protein 4